MKENVRFSFRRRSGWPMTFGAASVAVIVFALVPTAPNSGLGLAFGGIAFGGMGICALLGLRKRFLRIRLGSVAAWTRVHNHLGVLVLAFALLHARFHGGGPLTASLLVGLVLIAVSGIIGAVLQNVVPKMMTARLPSQATAEDPEVAYVKCWRQIHETIAQVVGTPQDAEPALLRAEAAAGVTGPSTGLKTVASLPTAHTLTAFYADRILPFLLAPRGRDVALAHDAEATLAFDALRGNVDASLRTVVDDVRALCKEARAWAEAQMLAQLLRAWQLIHIPVSVLIVLLTIVHVIASIYY